MDINQNYKIEKAVLFKNGRGVALGHNPAAPDPFVTWMFTERPDGHREYEWGHYGQDREAADRDFHRRAAQYEHDTFREPQAVQVEAPGLYKYFITQQLPFGENFPDFPHNAPDDAVRYGFRASVEFDTRQAWGYITLTKPISKEQMAEHHLLPSRNNPDLRRTMELETMAVGAWEDMQRLPDQKRLTWFYPDFGSFVLKEYVSPERLAEAAGRIGKVSVIDMLAEKRTQATAAAKPPSHKNRDTR